jgi:starvation-inducible DNA-binding protein
VARNGKTTTAAHDINIGLEKQELQGSVDILNRVLSDNHVLYVKTRKYHWNVTGRMFHSLHELLEEQYELLARTGDEIAERVRSLGAPAIGTIQEFQQYASLKEEPGDYPEANTMVQNLVDDHDAVIRNLRQFVDDTDEKFHDMGTSDFLTGVMEAHEKMAWMLRAFLEERAG